MNEVEKYFEDVYGFERNDWGFLNGTIQGIEYTLMHDPLNGYILQYLFVSNRQAGEGRIKLGRNPSMENFLDAVNKIYGIK